MSGTNTVPGTAPTGAVPFGDYYTRPDIGADAQKYADEVHAYSQRVQHYEGGLKTQARDVEGMGRALDYLQTRLNLAVASGDEALISTAKERYDQMYDQYKVARLEYARLYGEYEKAHSSYTSAWQAQSDYMRNQKEAEEQWRSSIRDPEAVKADLAAIEAQIKAQKTADTVAYVTAKYGGNQQTKSGSHQTQTYFTRPQDIPAIPTYSDSGVSVGTVTPELQALLDKQKLLQEEYEWAMYLPYADLMQNEDFAEKSQFKTKYRGGEKYNAFTNVYTDTGFDDIAYDYINRNPIAINRQGAADLQSKAAPLGLDDSERLKMTDNEIAIFNYIYATQSPEAAYEYIAYLTSGLNARQRAEQERQWAEDAKEKPGAASAVSVIMSPMKGLSFLGQAADYFADGKIDQNAGYNKFSYIPSAIREQVAEDIKASAKTEFWGGVGSFGYQTAMSMADFLATTLVSGGNSNLAMVIMGSGAAADTVIDAKDRGLSDGKAFALGTIAGVAEALTEKVSLSALMDLSALEKNAAGYILKNVWEEGAEEVTASLVNTVADVLISQDKSQWQQSIDAYVAQGKTEGQAFGLALADQALALGLDFLGGAFSGGVMAGGNAAISKGTTALANRQNQKQQTVPQGAAEVPAAATPETFQEEVQRQLTGNLGGKKAAQGATAQLAAPTVQVSQEVWQQGQRLAQLTGRNIKFYEDKPNKNGFFDPKNGEIWVNVKGGDPLAQVFSHELTHSIEQAGAYAKLSSLVLNRMQDAGMDLDTAREAKRQQYQRQNKPLPTQAAVDQELVAEYVSRNLLTNEQQIVSLVQQDRTLGQKIVGWFDGVLAKLGNKNAQERVFLSKARKLYAKALRQTPNVGAVQTATAAATEGTATEAVSMEELDTQLAAGEITDEEYAEIRQTLEEQQEEQYTAGERKYSIGKTVDNKPFVIVENDILDGVPESEWAKTVKDNLKQKFPHGVTVGRNQIQIDAQSRKELTYSGYTKWLRHNDPNAYGDKLRATDNADEILTASTDWTNEGANHSRNDKMQNFARGKVLIRVGGNDYNAEVIVGTEASGKMRLYDILNLQATQITEKEMVAATTENPSPGASRNTATISKETVSHDSEEVKRQYSLGEEAKIDSDYMDAISRGDTETAQKMVDEAAKAAGYTIKAYHGTSSEFNAFQRGNKRTRGSLNFGDGFYFSPSRSFAENYTTTGRVIEGYLKLNNPYEVYGTRFDRNDLERIGEMAGKEITIDNVTEVLRQLGYDGIIAKDYNGTTNPVNQYVIFDANQVKSADPVTYDDKGNVIPLSQRFDTSRDDIRYSLADEAEDSDKKPLAEFMGQYAQEKAEPWRQGSIVDDETVRQAHKTGYPVIDGVQVVPFVTWVRCTDPMPGSGEPRNNYGLVTGLGKEGQLLVSFNNKGEKADTSAEDAQAPSKKDNVPIAVEYLEPVRGKYQMTKAEWESLEQAMPEDPEQMDLTDEELAEIEELRNRAEATEEGVAVPGKEIHREDLPAKAKGMLETAERKLLWEIADKLGVPKLAGREYLQPIIQEMADEYLRTGAISQESRQLLFEKAYSHAVVVDAEFYNQYKDLKDHLRTNAVTISDRDKADIADFNDFRKRAFGTLRIVNEGGLPVDAAYQELHSMAPELFPESITHPADQLMRMYDVAKSIQVTEKTVQDYYGEEEPEYRKWARNEFEEAIGDATGKLWEVKRFAEEKAARESDTPPATAAEAMEAYLKLKKARREYEKVNAKNLLTERDQQQVGRLLRHEITLDDLQPGVDNVKGITAVFEAKQEYEKLCKQIAEYKRHLRGQARKKADVLLKTANNWKDKRMGIAYSRETMERNIYDIVPDKALAKQIIDQYFAPVHQSEAGATRFKNDYRDRVRALDLSRKVEKGNLVSEAHAVQLLGEAQDNIRMLENARGRIKQRDGKNRSEWEAVVGKLWAENPNLDRGKIEKAVKDFRYIYDTLFQKMNEVRVANGYEPINYRSGYFPHFQPGDSDSILAQFGRALGIDTRIDALPTTINGLTHTFKPGIQWFGNAQERLGFNTAYDAVEGFDKYIEGCASVIYHTENIQNLRALASQIRYRTSDEGIRQQVDEIYERQGITDEEKQKLIQDIYAHGQFTLSNFVTELDEYTNLLANKKSRYDRAIEAAMGRKVYSVLKAWEARVGANMIAGNLTSALTNIIPLTQAGAQMGKGTLLRGMWNTLQSYRADDGVVGISTFLTNRRGSDPLVRTWAQNASSVLGKPMELIDGFVSESIVRGAYLLNQQQGMSDAEAMEQADAFAASVMADRSKGAMPTLMQAGNPLFKAFTQFQLEVNNQFSEVFKDIPRRFREKGLAVLAWVLLKYFLGAWLYNELYEKLIGRRPALDPIGMLCDAYDDLQTDGFGTAGKNLAMNALEQLPFSSGLTMIGVELDGGRIPASSAVPDFTALWDAATTEGWSGKKRWKEIQDELNKLAYVVTPFGGNQASKIWKGVKAFVQGGSYNVDAEGNEFLQYPVYKDEPKDAFWSLVKASFLGKSSLDTAQDWVDSGFKSLNAKQTAAYQDMIAAGVKDRDAYALIQSIQGATETEEQKKAAVQRDLLRNSKVSGDGKAIVYYGLMASDKERELMDALDDLGADSGATVNALMDLKDAGNKAADKLGAISKAKLTDEEKAVLVGSVIGKDLLTEDGGLTQYAKFSYAIQNGMSVDQYIHYRTSGASIDHYLELRDMGVSIEDAMDAGIALQELKNSVQDPSTVQKWQAVIGSSDDPEVQMASLAIVMTDSQYAKVAAARGFGVSAKTYVDVNAALQKYDADGNGSFTQAEVTRAINSMKLTTTQRAVLWQLMTGSSSAKKNPYSEAIGQRVIDALAKAKAAGEKTGHSFEDEVMRQIVQNMGR